MLAQDGVRGLRTESWEEYEGSASPVGAKETRDVIREKSRTLRRMESFLWK
jgi:hypothetical protein